MNMKPSSVRVMRYACVCAIVCGSAGCGYSTGSLLPGHLKTIYVDNFKNEIQIGKEVTQAQQYTLYRPGLENEVTSAVIERFVFDGNLRIAHKEHADIMLTGSLADYRKEALRYDDDDVVEEYRIKIVVNLTLVDTVRDKVLWEEPGFTGEATYKTMGRSQASEESARDEALEDLSRRIVERTIERW